MKFFWKIDSLEIYFLEKLTHLNFFFKIWPTWNFFLKSIDKISKKFQVSQVSVLVWHTKTLTWLTSYFFTNFIYTLKKTHLTHLKFFLKNWLTWNIFFRKIDSLEIYFFRKIDSLEIYFFEKLTHLIFFLKIWLTWNFFLKKV